MVRILLSVLRHHAGILRIMIREAEACSQHFDALQMMRRILTNLLNTAPALSHCGYIYTAVSVGEYPFFVTFSLHPYTVLVSA